MNLPMIFNKLGSTIKNAAGSGALIAKKHAPEIMIVSGLAGFVVTIVETVKATNKSNDILNHRDERMDRVVEEARLNPENYPISDYNTDVSAVKKQARKELFKAWLPVATTGLSSAALILGGYRVLNGRYVATAAAYKTLEAGFERYRKNVTEEFGKEVDWRMAHSLKADELKEERERQKEIREKGNKIPRTQYSKDINNQIFDSHSSDRWKNYWTPDQVIDFVQLAESKLQDKVNDEGFALLNDAYQILGMPKTSQGAVVGWVRTPRNKHNEKGKYVSLGFANNETPEEEIRRIHHSSSNSEIYIWITPNTDGVVYNLIDVPFSER